MPPAKKRRVLADEAAVSDGAVTPDDSTDLIASKERAIDILYQQHKSTLQSLLADIAILTSLATSSSSTLLASQAKQHGLLRSTLRGLATLKYLTRQISLQSTQNHTESSFEKRKQVEQVSLVLENLNYEKEYLRAEIELCRGWNGEELMRLVSEEMGVELGRGGNRADDGTTHFSGQDERGGDSDNCGDLDEIIDSFLSGSNNRMAESTATHSIGTTETISHRNPQNRAIILQKLQNDIATRSNLVEKLSQSRLKLSQLQKRKEELSGHLKQIPKKLRQLEKAGEELSGFFGKAAAAAGFGDNDVIRKYDKDDDDDVTMEKKEEQEQKKIQEADLLVHQPSTATRMERFQLAQSKLPSPLYVLYVQLVGYLDAWSSLELLRQEPGSCSEKRDTYGKNDPLGGFVGAAGMDVVAVPPSNNDEEDKDTKNWNVVLSLTPSDILPPELSVFSPPKIVRNSKIDIVFSFDAGQGVVLAWVEDKSEILEEGFLNALFPGDDGAVSPNVSLGMLKGERGDNVQPTGEDAAVEIQDGELAETDTKNEGRPFPPPNASLNTYETSTIEADKVIERTTFQIQVCTKAVLRQVLRRIRARRTLSILLDALGKRSQMNPIPIHPSMKGNVHASGNNSNGNCSMASSPPVVKAKLVSWIEDSKYAKNPSTSPSMTRYMATIKRKSSTLKAFVLIDVHNYPCEPPIWALQYEDGTRGSASSWGQNHGSISSLNSPDINFDISKPIAPPLFDAVLHRIECHVNSDYDKFIRQDVETTFDWILMHQLAEIISCWDEAMSVGEKTGSGGSGGNSGRTKNGEDGGVVGYPRRLRKGRDRRLVGFGDRSPFFRYRNGL
ncbi:hypothetical protein ACHAXS_004265 [Conticribra weissflogii]